MPRTLAPEECQEIGRRYFQQQQYQKAVEAFTDAIEAAVKPTVAQYDQRAASYEKLQDFNSALKDGRNMISLDKKDVKGYLRTGTILQKMEKPAKAIDIYKYGMKHVPVANKEFKILQQLHDQLTRKLSPAKSFDPFTVLPSELAQMVMQYLTFRQLVNCLRVSKGWKTFLSQSPRLWLDLDLSGARKDVSRIFIRNAVKYSGFKLQRFVIDRFRHPDVIRNITTVCKDLTSLEFRSGGLMSATVIEAAQCSLGLKKLVVHTEIPFHSVVQIFRLRPMLEHAEFHAIVTPLVNGNDAEHDALTDSKWGGPFPNLHTLHLQQFLLPNVRQYRAERFQALFERAPRLASLITKVWDNIFVRPVGDLSKLPLTHAFFQDLKGLLRLPPTLQHLSFIDAGSWYSWLPALTHLTLSGSNQLEPSRVHEILNFRPMPSGQLPDHYGLERLTWERIKDFTGISNLQHLAFRNFSVTSIHDHPVRELLECSPRILTKELQSLDLTALPVKDTDLEFLAHEAQNSLHTINLSRTTVTGAGVKDLVDNIPTLRTLILDDCMRISSRDIVDYAEKKGIKVSMKMKEGRNTAGGRRVRYG